MESADKWLVSFFQTVPVAYCKDGIEARTGLAYYDRPPFAMPKYRLRAAKEAVPLDELTEDQHRSETRNLLLRKLRAETLIEELKAYQLIEDIGEADVFHVLSTVREWAEPAEQAE
ncbi:hypothetical protein [Rhizobium sp. AN80A]|uniref:hypothetical protein n=1 Tax=Rhizobium sp. AN80A TaxID=3040673 RepID=UPI0024B3A609|nr:hypothetical protein [Rhizobium sp. AN80A]